MEEATAPCPVCNRLVSLENINSHIDICLLPGEVREQRTNIPSPKVDDENATTTTCTCVSSPSVARVQPSTSSSSLVSSQPRAVRATERKRRSLSPSANATSSKQSLLSFSQNALTQSCTPPPTKVRKLYSTGIGSTIAQKRSSRDGGEHGEPVAASSRVNMEGKGGVDTGELSVPLAEAMRPSSIENYVGQENVMGKNAILRTVFESGHVPSLIFWGPPGCGKTTLARIIAKVAHQKLNTKFVQLSATTAGVKEVKEIVKVARNEKIMFKRNTILFIDEIHRFNKLQQDAFLPHVEDGTITLLGATTENPSFQLNSALLSRCRVIVLEKLQSEDIEQLLRRALEKLGAEEKYKEDVANGKQLDSSRRVLVEPEALTTLSQLCDGDARSALNGLEMAVHAKRRTTAVGLFRPQQKPTLTADGRTDLDSSKFNSNQASQHGQVSDLSSVTVTKSCQTESPDEGKVQAVVTVDDVLESLQRSHLLYDRAGEEHYNIISALHKSMRGSDANASLYWLARMLSAGEDPLYVARRVVRFASEDIGLADANALNQAVAAFQACQLIGMPECQVILAQAVVYMARAPKSVEVYMAYEKAKQCIMEHKGPLPSVPLHLRNAPTQLMRSLGYGKGYKYNPGFSEPVEQQYLPDGLEGMDFFEYTAHNNMC